jgi:phosphoribosylformylglycinamidine synthase
MESHNHPSFIEPYQGAATGVGGILRDVFTMGARPIALLDPLFFGDPDAPRMHSLIDGVVRGVGGYGNCIGIPTVGGMTLFHPAYNKNILVNVMAVGLVRHDRMFRAKASGPGNPVLYAGSKTGRDGIHGASMASDVFDDEKSKRRPTVQVGDPFAEKLVMEAVLEVLEGDAVVAIQDMGAAGLTSSTFEMCSRGGVGMRLDLAKVPAREEGMTPYEFMLSESQERMVIVAHKGREHEVTAVFEKWGVDVSVIGEVIAQPRMELLFHGEEVANLPIAPLVEDAPIYRRPFVMPQPSEEPIAPPPGPPVREALEKLLASPNLCGKAWISRQYDWSVQTNTVFGPGSDAAVLRVKGTRKGLAMTADVNPRYVAAHPERGAALAVAEAALNIACTGARPLAITDCLNFGNPERPEVMGQFAAAIKGISLACQSLSVPVISGNVSLYNETDGRSILPTPTIGMVGLLEDVTNAVPHAFQAVGDDVAILGKTLAEFGASEYLATVAGIEGGPCPRLDLDGFQSLVELLVDLAERQLISSAHDVAEGGLAVALCECGSGPKGLGASLNVSTGLSPTAFLFSESSGRAIITFPSANRNAVVAAARGRNVPIDVAGRVIEKTLTVGIRGEAVLEIEVEEARKVQESAFPRLMEVIR